jgi:hypothetical protein
VHIEKNKRRSLTVAVRKIDDLRLQICQNGLDRGVELAGLRRCVPDSTGMLTFSKNRMLYLLMLVSWIHAASSNVPINRLAKIKRSAAFG